MGVEGLRQWGVVRKIAAISAIIQGLTWLILALICISIYYIQPGLRIAGVLDEDNRFTELLSYCFYDTLLNEVSNHNKRALTPQNFHIFAWFYAISSACWLALAIWECVALFRKTSSKYEAHVLMVLGVVTILICILDVILLSVAFSDYFGINVFKYDLVWESAEVSDPTTTTTTTTSTTTTPSALSQNLIDYRSITGFVTDDERRDFQESIDVALKYIIGRKIIYGILITLSARGFIIWFINCAFGVILVYLSMQIFRAPPILKYDNRSIPRPKIASQPPPKDEGYLFGSFFAEDGHLSTPPAQEKRYSQPPIDWYERPQPRSSPKNPLALDNNRNMRGQNRFNY